MTQKEKNELNKKELQAGTDNETVASNPEEKPAGKMIEVDSDVLKQLVKELRETKATVEQLSSNAVAQSPNMQVRRKARVFDYKVRKWDGKIVVGFENVGTEKRPLEIYIVYNKDTRKEEQFVNLIFKGESKPLVKVNYSDYVRDAERVTCRLISKVDEEEVVEDGSIYKKEMAENSYGMFETMVTVPVEVVTQHFMATLKLPEDEGGDEIVIHSTKLNS